MKEIANNELFYAKLDDKIKFCNTRNKITHTDFLTEPEIIKAEKHLHSVNVSNYFFFGGYEEANRKMLFFFPSKISYDMAFSNVNQILEVLRIELPNSQINHFAHKDYLSAIMKLGIIREKFGDIIVYPEGADFIVQKENAFYFRDHLQELIRFRKSTIRICDIANIHENTSKTEEISIIINSMRVDNFVAEICHCSRNKAEEVLLQEKVMINYEPIAKASKTVDIGDIITIRGFGRYIVKEFSRKTKSDKNVIILIHNC